MRRDDPRIPLLLLLLLAILIALLILPGCQVPLR
jgi:hypothetical protein